MSDNEPVLVIKSLSDLIGEGYSHLIFNRSGDPLYFTGGLPRPATPGEVAAFLAEVGASPANLRPLPKGEPIFVYKATSELVADGYTHAVLNQWGDLLQFTKGSPLDATPAELEALEAEIEPIRARRERERHPA